MNKETTQNDNPDGTRLAEARALAVQAVETVCAEWEGVHETLVKLAYPNAKPKAPEDYVNTKVANVCYYGDMPALQLLIAQGANLHIDNEKPLHMAAEAGQTEMVRFLLDNNANIHAADDLALRWAVEKWHFGTADLLMERGADFHQLSSDEFKKYDAYKIEQKKQHEKLAVIREEWQTEKNLASVFNAKAWAGHVNEMAALWNQIPEPLQEGIDLSHIVAQVQHATLRQNKKKPVFVR